MNRNIERKIFLSILIIFLSVSVLFAQRGADKISQDTSADTISITDNLTGKTDTLSDDTSSARGVQTEDTVRYEADDIDYDIRKKIIFMRGNGVVKYNKMTLYADTIHFLFEKNILVAKGMPQLIEGSDTVVGESMVYDLKTRRGKVHFGTAHSEDSRYTGYDIARSDDKGFYIQDGAYSSCAVVDSPHYCFYGKHIKIIPKDKAISRPAVLNVAGAPLVALPYFVTPLDKGRHSGWLTPKWGGNPTHGGYLDNMGYYLAPNDYVDFTVASRVREFSSYVLKGSSSYALRYWLSGRIASQYSMSAEHDTLNKKWSLDYSHNQNLLPDESMKLSGRGSIVSGKDFYKNLSEDTAKLTQKRITANMALTKNFRKINANSSIKWDRSHNFKDDNVSMDLPSFSFNLGSRRLIPVKEEEDTKKKKEDKEDKEDNEKWYNKISYSYDMAGKRKYKYNAQGPREESLFDYVGARHNFSISAPQKIFRWFDITPHFSFHQSFFDAYIDTTTIWRVRDSIVIDTVSADSCPSDIIFDSLIIDGVKNYIYPTGDTILDTFPVYDTICYRRSDFEWKKMQTYSWDASLKLSTKIYGIFPIKIFNFTGMRHVFTPSVSYEFTPKKDLDRRYPNVVGYTGTRERAQEIRFSFGNGFQGRIQTSESKDKDEPVEKTFEMFNFNTSVSYNFEEKLTKWSNISISGRIPNKFVNFSASATLRLYNENSKIGFPKPLKFSLSLSPKWGGVKGDFWGGDFLVLDSLQPENYMQGYVLKKPGWSMSFRPRYSFSISRNSVADDFETDRKYSLDASANIQFTHKWSASWSSRYDFTKNKFMSHSMNFNCDLECWELRFSWDPSGYNQGSFHFIVRIKKHPEVKWERRPGDSY